MQALYTLVLFLPAILLITIVPAHAQDINATDSDEARTAAFVTTNPTNDFNATGRIASIVMSNERNQQTYVLAGNWSLLVSDGNVTNLKANITMVSVDGTDRHTHVIANFRPNVVVPVILDVHGTVFSGLTDVSTNGNTEWRGMQTTVTISKQDTISILLNTARNVGHTDNHFNGQPVYGVVFSIRGY